MAINLSVQLGWSFPDAARRIPASTMSSPSHRFRSIPWSRRSSRRLCSYGVARRDGIRYPVDQVYTMRGPRISWPTHECGSCRRCRATAPPLRPPSQQVARRRSVSKIALHSGYIVSQRDKPVLVTARLTATGRNQRLKIQSLEQAVAHAQGRLDAVPLHPATTNYDPGKQFDETFAWDPDEYGVSFAESDISPDTVEGQVRPKRLHLCSSC